MSTPKDFFTAGLAMEEAREARDAARVKLREAAAVACPSELKLLDEATDALNHAETVFSEIIESAMKGSQALSAQAAMADHAATCDNPNCPIKKQLAGVSKKESEKLN